MITVIYNNVLLYYTWPMKSQVDSWSIIAKKATRSAAVMAELPIRQASQGTPIRIWISSQDFLQLALMRKCPGCSFHFLKASLRCQQSRVTVTLPCRYESPGSSGSEAIGRLLIISTSGLTDKARSNSFSSEHSTTGSRPIHCTPIRFA